MTRRIISAFDLDRTLTVNHSVESAFILFLLKKRKVKITNLILAAFYFLTNINDPVKASKQNKMYLYKICHSELELLVEEFLRQCGNRLLSLEVAKLVKEHKIMGHTVILLTGCPSIIVTPLVNKMNLEFDRIYSVQLECVGDVYTGRLNGPHYYGSAKADVILHLEEELDIDLERSFCYADSGSDLEMMSLFGNPVAVNPDQKLKKAAQRYQWKVLMTH